MRGRRVFMKTLRFPELVLLILSIALLWTEEVKIRFGVSSIWVVREVCTKITSVCYQSQAF